MNLLVAVEVASPTERAYPLSFQPLPKLGEKASRTMTMQPEHQGDSWVQRGNLGDSKQKMSQVRPLPLKCLNLLDFLIFGPLYASHTDTQRKPGIDARGKKTHLGRE